MPRLACFNEPLGDKLLKKPLASDSGAPDQLRNSRGSEVAEVAEESPQISVRRGIPEEEVKEPSQGTVPLS